MDTTTTTTRKPTAPEIQVIKLGEGKRFAQALNLLITDVEAGKVTAEQAAQYAAKCDHYLDGIFGTPRTIEFEKVQRYERGQLVQRAPEFNQVKAALNTLRKRIGDRYPEIGQRHSRTRDAAAAFGFGA